MPSSVYQMPRPPLVSRSGHHIAFHAISGIAQRFVPKSVPKSSDQSLMSADTAAVIRHPRMDGRVDIPR
jgi:hypothetical protein